VAYLDRGRSASSHGRPLTNEREADTGQASDDFKAQKQALDRRRAAIHDAESASSGEAAFVVYERCTGGVAA
jgi:hypothetical protein